MARSTNSFSKTFVWILLGLLIVGLAGFGSTNLSGGINSIGRVGNEDISVNQYVRALQNEMREASNQFGTELSFQQAMLFGLQQQVLNRLVMEKTLEDEANKLNISVGDATVRDQLMKIQAFQGVDGLFNRTAYGFMLDNAGISEVEFEEQIRADTSRMLLQQAVIDGIYMPSVFSKKAIDYLAQERTISLLELDETDLPEALSDPTDEELLTYYENNIELFSLPESKSITYVILTPQILSKNIIIDKNELLAAYERKKDTYNRPEQRAVERLNFLDIEGAAAAYRKLENNEIDFEYLVTERGLTLADVSLGYVSKQELKEASDAVFELAEGQISVPQKTELGASIFRVKSILSAQTKSFNDVREDLNNDLRIERAVQLIDVERTRIADLLAAGASLEELASESDMSLGKIIYHDGVETDLTSYNEFKSAAQNLTPSDYPKLVELSDEGILAMQVNEILPERASAFTSVKKKVISFWRDDALNAALAVLGEEKVVAARNGAELVSLGSKYKKVSSLKRDGNIPNTPLNLIPEAFELNEGEFGLIPGNGSVFLLQLNSVEKGDTVSPNAEASRQQFADKLNQSLANDVFQIYLSEIQKLAGVSLNEQALNAVHANFN